jgi:hypothetical protein
MSLILLFVSFLSGLCGAYVFFTGYIGAEGPNQELTAAMVGMAFAMIPYFIAKSLAEMVAIRQRHLQMEQIAQIGFMLTEETEEEQQAPAADTPPPPAPEATS